MSSLPPGLMQAILLITAGVVVSMLVALLLQRTLRRRRYRRRAALDERLRPLVLAATVAEDDEIDDLLARVRAATREERVHVGRTALHMLRDVTGEAAERLRAVCDAAGLVPRVLAAARGRDAVQRANAAEALGLLHPPEALPLLRELAVDRAPAVRSVAIRALGAFEHPTAVELVVEALRLGSGVPNSVAASALLQQGVAAGDHVRRALDADDPGVRGGAARVAGLLRAPGSGEALARLVVDEQVSVRLAAMRSLERLPVRSAVPALLDAALADGVDGEAAASMLAALPAGWTAEAMRRLDEQAAPAVRRAAGLPRREVRA